MVQLKFKINDSYESPELIDYDILGFHKKRTIIVGELKTIEYYRHYDGITYSDLVVLEERAYNRSPNGLIISRTLKVSWFLTDGTVGLIMQRPKFYSANESIQEGIDRRSNIIADAKLYCLSHIGQAYGFDLLVSLKAQIEIYIDGYHQPLIDGVNNSTKPYLTLQHRIDLTNILTF